MKLQTGGKAIPQRENLFVFNGAATNIVGVKDPFWHDPGHFVQSIPVLRQNIAIGQLGKLGGDGNLYVALKDGDEQIVTPDVAGMDYFTFGLVANKHTLTLTANTNDLSTTVPEFCVGQKVNLEAAWSPPLPGDTQSSYHWIADLDFINKIVSPATNEASTSYVLDMTLLTNNPAPVWWYNGGNKFVWCQTTNLFSNGQKVSITQGGYQGGTVSIYRPSISYFEDTPPSYATNCMDGGSLYLQLGDGNLHGDMVYEVDVDSSYDGKVGLVQLIKRDASNGSVHSGSLGTGGELWLDTQNHYNGYLAPVSANIESPYHFSDNPGVGDVASLLSATTSCSDQFIDYVVFRPKAGNEDDNIFVTLGVVSGGNPSWGWSASTYWLAGWSTPTGSVTRPTDPDDSDAFPTWLHTYQNSQ